MRGGKGAASRILVILALAFALTVGGCAEPAPAPPSGLITGRVIDLDGAPIKNVDVSADGEWTTSDDNGNFSIVAPATGSWVSVTRSGFLSRTRAGFPGDPLLMRMTPDDGRTVSLRFGGDVMMGRRFFDPNEDGDREDGLIAEPANADEHSRLLASIAPLLSGADIAEVNVESPITDDPYLDPSEPRAEKAHATKEYVFASGPGLPPALRRAGVDVVGLANNHQFDLLDAGVRSTVDEFAAAGFRPGSGQFGVGPSADLAYRPAIVEAKGVRFALLGCTTITGENPGISYVAGPSKGGAAPCDPVRVRDTVAAAKAGGNVVVFSVHGGFEYERKPSEQIRTLTQIARQAGATLVVNHHPHVVSGVDWNGATLAAWSMGNLVFDQTVWPTFQSYVLNVDVRAGRIVRAYLEPLMVERFTARGIGSRLADHIGRVVAGWSHAPLAVEDGVIELAPSGKPPVQTTTVPMRISRPGDIGELGEGWLLTTANPAAYQFGRDLLWTGDFDSNVLGGGQAPLWTQDAGGSVATDPDPARGAVYQLRRDKDDATPAVSSPLHRLLLSTPPAPPPAQPGPAPRPTEGARGDVSLTGVVQVDPGARVEVQLSWFNDTRGPSSSQTVQVIYGDPAGQGWRPLRIDAPVPPDAVAVQPFMRLYPPAAALQGPQPASAATARFDAMRVIEWSGPGSPPTPETSHVRSDRSGTVVVQRATTALDPMGPPLTILPR